MTADTLRGTGLPEFIIDRPTGSLHVERQRDGGHIIFTRTQDGATAWGINPADSLSLSRYLKGDGDDSEG